MIGSKQDRGEGGQQLIVYRRGRLGGADWAARDRYVSLMLKHVRA